MNQRTQPIDRQLNFDWPKRMERDALIDRIGFRKRPFKQRNGVSPSVLKGVLNRIARFQVNFEGRTKIGNAVGVTEKQISRAIHVLVKHDLITLDFKKNEIARRTLNHYQINWNALRLLVEQQEHEKISGPTDGTFLTDRWDIGSPTDETFSIDRWDIGSPTDGTLGALVREKEIERETTTYDEWKPVVVLLEKLGVGKARDAIATATARNATPSDVKRIIERVATSDSIEPSKRAGAIYNQVCNPTPLPAKPMPKLKRPERERIRASHCSQAIAKGIRPCDLDHDAIDAQTDRDYQRQLAEYEKQLREHKQQFDSLAATEPTR